MKRADTIGARIREARTQQGIGVRELARATGVAPSTLSRAENEIGGMLAEQVAPLADALGVTTDWLLRGRETTKTERERFARRVLRHAATRLREMADELHRPRRRSDPSADSREGA